MEENPFIVSLPEEAKLWFAKAVAGMVVSDGHVTEAELDHLKHTIRFLGNMEEVNEIVNMIKRKENVQLNIFKADRHTATRMFLELATIAISDGSLATAEVNYFKYVGNKLGFESFFCEKVLKWGMEHLNITKQRKILLKEGAEIEPIYKTFD